MRLTKYFVSLMCDGRLLARGQMKWVIQDERMSVGPSHPETIGRRRLFGFSIFGNPQKKVSIYSQQAVEIQRLSSLLFVGNVYCVVSCIHNSNASTFFTWFDYNGSVIFEIVQFCIFLYCQVTVGFSWWSGVLMEPNSCSA